MAIDLSHIYTTNFGQQSGKRGVILISTTSHTKAAVNAIIQGRNTPKLLLSAETHSQFCWYKLYPVQDPGILCQDHVLAQLYQPCSYGSYSFNPTFITYFFHLFLLLWLHSLIFVNSLKQHTTFRQK